MKIKVGSRESALAIKQAELVIASLQEQDPNLEVELVTMKTTGDMILDRPLDKIGGKGLFVKELDLALAENRVDLTVHSLKDMPMETPEQFPFLAVSKRENYHDVLLLPKGQHEIDFSKPLGCASARRKIQLERLYPNCKVESIRGNVLTRIEKLDGGKYGAIVLAAAGLIRLGLEHRIVKQFSVEEILPAAGQGVIVVQGRWDFPKQRLQAFHHGDSWDISMAERSFVEALDGGCSSPIAAFATISQGVLSITGMYVDEREVVWKKQIHGTPKEAVLLGKTLAQSMKKGEI